MRSPSSTDGAVIDRADADSELFNLDVTLIEVADSAALVNVTDDGCGSTCGACVTNAA